MRSSGREDSIWAAHRFSSSSLEASVGVEAGVGVGVGIGIGIDTGLGMLGGGGTCPGAEFGRRCAARVFTGGRFPLVAGRSWRADFCASGRTGVLAVGGVMVGFLPEWQQGAR